MKSDSGFIPNHWNQGPYYNQLYHEWMQYFHQLYRNEHLLSPYSFDIPQKREIITHSVLIQAPEDLVDINRTFYRNLADKNSTTQVKLQQKYHHIQKKSIPDVDNSTQSRYEIKNTVNNIHKQEDKEQISRKYLHKVKKQKKIVQKNEQEQNSIQQISNTTLKKKVMKMLYLFSKDEKKYQTIIQEYKDDKSIEGDIIRFIDQRIKSFGKSKEEMTKAIIRRVQKYHKQSVGKTRVRQFMNFGGLKSMNRKYLSQIFANPEFKKSYISAYRELQEFFKSDNKSKIKKLLIQVGKVKNIEDINNLDAYLNGKSKMPWPQCIMQRLMKVMNELYNTYINQ